MVMVHTVKSPPKSLSLRIACHITINDYALIRIDFSVLTQSPWVPLQESIPRLSEFKFGSKAIKLGLYDKCPAKLRGNVCDFCDCRKNISRVSPAQERNIEESSPWLFYLFI